MLLGLCGTPGLAQETSGGISTTIPTLRGSVADPSNDAPALLPGGAVTSTPLPGGAATSTPLPGGAASPSAGDPFNPDPSAANQQAAPTPPRKFAPPKTSAKTSDRIKLPPNGPPKLPPLQAYPTASRPRGGGAAIDTLDNQTIPGPTVAALPVATRVRTKVDDKAYDPVGVEFGSLLLTPYVSQSFGFDSNPDQTQTGVRPSAFSRTEGGLGAISQWSANELRADLRAGYNDYFNDPQANRPDATGTVDLRVDVDRDTAIDAEQRFNIDTQRPGSPELNVNAIDRPLITSFGETLGATRTFGPWSIGLHGLFDRTDYENATLSDGSVEDLSDENFNDYGLRLRGSYEITPVFKPFVDVLVDRRVHDRTIDFNGFARDSTGIIGQAGSSFEFSHLFAGELSAGYGDRSFQDPRLKDVSGPVVNGTLAYAITPITLISLKASTGFDETNVSGASGSQSRSVTLEVAHQLLRNLTLTGALSYLNTEYVGAPITENTWAETLKAEYHLSRSLVATATYNHEDLTSTAAGSGFSQDVFLVGLRVQR